MGRNHSGQKASDGTREKVMSSSSKKPNILVIMTDTQRCDTLAYMGNPQAVSPNLDRLAKEGVYFNRHTLPHRYACPPGAAF